MRLRHIPGAEQEIAKSPYVVQNPEEHKGAWNLVFGNDNPIEIEVGMGKGRFIMELAAAHPDRNYVGIERYSSVLLRGLRKMDELRLPNLWFLCADAAELDTYFGPGEVSVIYLNFSDPWPKDRHAKRRLTSERFLPVYDRVLSREGRLEFKTDNRGLFEYSLESVSSAGWKVVKSTFDLHHSDLAKGNVMTEYESKFVAEGKPICKLTAGR